MATPFWLEDFAGWPGAGENVFAFSGTGWSGNYGTVVADTDMGPAGKALNCPETASNLVTTYAIPGAVPATPSNFSFMFKRTADAMSIVGNRLLIPFDASNGIFFGLNISPNVGSVVLVRKVAGVQTTMYASPNDYALNVAYRFAISFNSSTGDVSLYRDNTLLFTGNVAAFIGKTPTGMQFGRIDIGTTGGYRISQIFGYGGGGGYVGPREIRTGFPTANQALQDWAVVGVANAWDAINNVYSAAPTQYVEASAAGQVSQFTCPVNNTNMFGVDGVEYRTRATRTDAGAVTMNGQAGTAGVYTDGAVFAPPQTTYQDQHDFYGSINPNTGLGWTAGDLLNNQVGVERVT